eukprot:scaffold31594_cov118-Isochrysis_galbana.AAC.1
MAAQVPEGKLREQQRVGPQKGRYALRGLRTTRGRKHGHLGATPGHGLLATPGHGLLGSRRPWPTGPGQAAASRGLRAGARP